MNKITQSILIIILFAISLTTHAQTEHKSTVTEPVVQKMLKSFEAIKSEFKQHQANSAKDLSKFITANNAMEKVNGILQKHGYQDFMQWQSELMRVAMVYAAYQQKRQQPKQTEIEKQIAKIRNNPNLSAEQKESMINMMTAASTMVSNMVDANENELAVIEKYASELKVLFDQ